MPEPSCSGSCDSGPEQAGWTPTATPATPAGVGYVSEYLVTEMDCPSEEGMIRLALEQIQPGIVLEFDLPARRVRVFHGDNAAAVEQRMLSLGLGASRQYTRVTDAGQLSRVRASRQAEHDKEAAVLKWLLLINAIMFGIELAVGWMAQSTGLIADSLDMFADAAVYGVALYAVGRGARAKLRAAHLMGWLQVILALGALSEVGRRFVFGSEPVSTLMMGIGAVALVANVSCLILITKSRSKGAHMTASMICSSNDVVANLGVILAGVLVSWTGSRYPDLVIGLIIGAIVLHGARRILQIKS